MNRPSRGSRVSNAVPWGPAHTAVAAALAVAAGLWVPEAAAQGLAPPDQAAFSVVRALGHDKGLVKRGGGKLVVGVLVRGHADAGVAGDPLVDPPADAPAFLDALARLDLDLARRVKVQVVPMSAATAAEAEALLTDTKLSALYIDGGFSAEEAARLRAAAEKKCIFTLYRAPAYEGAFALGVLLRGGRVKLVVNLATSNACGVELDPPSLQTAIVL